MLPDAHDDETVGDPRRHPCLRIHRKDRGVQLAMPQLGGPRCRTRTTRTPLLIMVISSHVSLIPPREPPKPSSSGLLCSLWSLGIYPCHLSSHLNKCKLKEKNSINKYCWMRDRTISYPILCIHAICWIMIGHICLFIILVAAPRGPWPVYVAPLLDAL
jgi:hypothetical protein